MMYIIITVANRRKDAFGRNDSPKLRVCVAFGVYSIHDCVSFCEYETRVFVAARVDSVFHHVALVDDDVAVLVLEARARREVGLERPVS